MSRRLCKNGLRNERYDVHNLLGSDDFSCCGDLAIRLMLWYLARFGGRSVEPFGTWRHLYVRWSMYILENNYTFPVKYFDIH